MPREGADHDVRPGIGDAAQARDTADVDQRAGVREPQFHHRQQRVAAGQHAGILAVGLQKPDRVGDAVGALVVECLRDHAAPPFCIAFHTVSGVSGMSRSRTPIALQTALTTAGDAAIVPASPMPFTPSGFGAATA